MGDNFKYTSGLHNVGSYRVAGTPYVTSSVVTSENELQLQFPRVTRNIKVRLDSSGTGGEFASGSLTVAYPTASASPTYTSDGTLESDHHGDTISFDGTTFTVNYEGTGSFGANEIKTYEQTGSAIYFTNNTNIQDVYLITQSYGTDRSFVPNDGNPWSVSLWMNKVGAGDPYGVVFKFGSTEVLGGGYSLEFTTLLSINGQTPYVWQPKNDGGAISVNWGAILTAGQYEHMVLTCDGASNQATYELYLDGVSQGTQQMPVEVDDMCNFNEHLYIGDGEVDPIIADREVNGYIQTFGIWNKELNASEANELYNSGSVKIASNSSMQANLVDWWRFDSSSVGFQTDGGTLGTSYISNEGTTLTSGSNFLAINSVQQGIPIERHTQTEFYNAVTTALDTTSNYGTFSVVSPTANSTIINITASVSGTAANGALSGFSANETFTAATDTAGGVAGIPGSGVGNLRIHFRSKDYSNVIANGHYWTLTDSGDSVELNAKAKEIYVSADGGDCSFTLTSDLTNIPKSRMYQHTGSGVDE